MSLLGGIGAALGIAGSIADGLQARKDAGRLNKASKERAKLNRAAALESLLEQSFDVSLRALQEDAQLGAAQTDAERQFIGQAGAISASAGAANIAGQSVSDFLNEAQTTADRTLGRLRLFGEFRDLANFRDISNLRLQAKNRINAVKAQRVREPSLLRIGLGAIAGGGQGFLAGKQIEEAF